MGASTNAVLFWGFACDDEGSKPWLDYDTFEGGDEEYGRLSALNFEEFLMERHNYQSSDNPWPDWLLLREKTFGIKDEERVPYERYQEERELSSKWRDENRARLDVLYEEKKAFLKKVHNGVELGTHCSNSYPMYYVAINEAGSTASRGGPVEFSPEELAVSEEDRAEWVARLTKFCENTGIACPRDFGWVLVSYWSE